MARTATLYRCSGCGATSAKWLGRCTKCGEYGTVDAERPAAQTGGIKGARAHDPPAPAQRVADIAALPVARLASGIGEFDRVVGGGLVPGQVVLLAGPPGSGKSTLVLAVADAVARTRDGTVLYVSGEESASQVAVRARRIGADAPGLLVAEETDLGAVLGHVDQHGDRLRLVVIDSVQTIAAADVDGRAGGVNQVMTVAQAVTRVAKARGVPVVLVGQVTKDASVAGPRALEHIVDATLSLDGDHHTSLRLLRAVKNRFGALEVAAFEQTDTGMHEVVDPSTLFRGDREQPVPGTCITVTVDGQRALLAEVQALVGTGPSPQARRSVSGLDSARMAMLTAVTERATGSHFQQRDVFVATLGGMRLSDPGADLAVCLAVASAATGETIPLDLAAIGEVALSGDVRPVPMLAERVAEATRLGYRRLLVPPGAGARLKGRDVRATCFEVGNLGRAAMVAFS